MPVCYDPDPQAATSARTSSSAGSPAGGRSTPSCRARRVRRGDAVRAPGRRGRAIPCGPDVDAHVEAVRPFVDAGFTHVALVQIGGHTQPAFL